MYLASRMNETDFSSFGIAPSAEIGGLPESPITKIHSNHGPDHLLPDE